MLRALTLATLFAVLPGAASGQTLRVLHIKVTLTDAAGTPMPVARHALLISDNPATSTPRRVVTTPDGTADVRLRPDNYTVESDEPFAFGGKGYQWTETLDVPAGRDVVLELTARNAEVGPAPAPVPAPAPKKDEPQWRDSVVSVWTPQTRESGVVVDAAGLVVTNARGIGDATAIEVQLTPSVKVAARVLAADRAKDVAVLWIDPGVAAAVHPVPINCADGRKDLEFARIAPAGDVCDVIALAEKARRTAQPPVATLRPVEPLRPIPAAVLDAAVQRRVGNLNPYLMSSSDFDIAFFTPVLVKGATKTDFGDLSAYFAEGPSVLVVRVTPKMAEAFWTKVARGAAYTQGAAIPAIKHFKPGFARMQALCGDVEVMPIHPFVLERRTSETEATREGLYVFDPQALGPHCKSVTLVVYSEKEPAKPDTRTVDPKVIDRIGQDFAGLN